VKPPNILLDEAGHAYLADFGIARIVAGGDEATQTGAIMGTPKYMSPEQTRGDRVDHRCDVYSLGIVAYEMLTGKAPFSGATPMNIAVKHLMDPVPAPDPDLMAPPLAAAVLKCLAKQPEDRYDSAGEFVEALESGLREVEASPAPRPGATDRALIESASAAPQAPTSPPPPRTRPPRAPERTPTRPAPARPRRLGGRASSLRTRALALGAGLVLLTGGVVALAWLRPSAPAPDASSEPTPPPPPTIAADVDAAGPEASIAPAPRPLTSAGTLELFERVCEEGDAASC
jgi:serine/threonine protein kinase